MHSLPLRTEIERSYRILELDTDASNKLIERSWRKLVDEWRPDRFGGDSVLQARAINRIAELNRARETLKAHLASEPPQVTGRSIRNRSPARIRSSFRRPLMASTTFAGVALAAILIAHPLSTQKSKPTQVSNQRAVPAAEATPPTPSPRSEILLVPHAALTVSASLVADGRILLPETMLHAGEITAIPRLGPIYIKYSAGENLEIEMEGHRYPMPDAGPNRARIN